MREPNTGHRYRLSGRDNVLAIGTPPWMNPTAGEQMRKATDVEWNKDGRPVNWNGHDWSLYKNQMMWYLVCVDVKRMRINWIEFVLVTLLLWRRGVPTESLQRQNMLLAKVISSSLSCTLARQVMRFDSGFDM